MDAALACLARYLSDYAYLGLFLILSVGGFGLPIPEEVVLVAAGLFVAQGTTTLAPTLAVCAAGMVVGDLLFFAVGRRYGTAALHGLLRRLVPPERFEHVLAQMRRYGQVVVFFGRYLTGVRPAVFLAAGASRIPVRRFLLLDGLSAAVSLVVWVLLGWAASDWLELVLHAVRNAEELILAALLSVLLLLVLEKLALRLGWVRRGSPLERAVRVARVPLLLAVATFAVLIAREHHEGKRERLAAAGQGEGEVAVKDVSLLVEVLPRLAPREHPVEVVFAGSRELLEEALLASGYRHGSPARPSAADLFGRPPDIALRSEESHARGLVFWRSPYVHRGEAVWFGRFVGAVTRPELRRLSRSLTRSHYTLRTAVGPVLHRGERRRVLWAVLRDPD